MLNVDPTTGYLYFGIDQLVAIWEESNGYFYNQVDPAQVVAGLPEYLMNVEGFSPLVCQVPVGTQLSCYVEAVPTYTEFQLSDSYLVIGDANSGVDVTLTIVPTTDDPTDQVCPTSTSSSVSPASTD